MSNLIQTIWIADCTFKKMSEPEGGFFPGIPFPLSSIICVHRRGDILVVTSNRGVFSKEGAGAMYRPLRDAVRRHTILSSSHICPAT